MENYITALNNYMEENKTTPNCPDAASLLDMLFCCYNQRKCLNTDTVRRNFRELDDILNILPLHQQDRVIDLACELCVEHQREAFQEGIFVGFRLHDELQVRR